METLYVNRPVTNWKDIDDWAKSVGFKSTLGADMHVTIAFSRDPVNVGEDFFLPDPYTSPMSNDRVIKPLGDQGAMVLGIKDAHLSARWQEFIDEGARWDWPEYQPHITISYNSEGIDQSKIEPYMGKIEFGPEVHKPVDEDWKSKVTEKRIQKAFRSSEIAKVDEELGLVFGYGIVCKVDGEDYVDLQNQHVPESVMLKSLLDFALNSNMAKDMHGHGVHGDDSIGGYPFLFPMTEEIAKSLDIKIKKSGALVALKPEKSDVLQKFKDGTYTGFSIGGFASEIREVTKDA